MSSVLLVLAAGSWCGVQVTTGTPWTALGQFLLGALGLLLLPGLVAVRALRRRPAPLLEDCAWAVPAGLAMGLAAWAVDRLLPRAVPAWPWTLVLAGVLLAWPAGRRRVLARGGAPWRASSRLALTLVSLVATAWMTAGYLVSSSLQVGVNGRAFYQDTLYQVALVDELGRTAHPQYPMVAGTPLSYHWFVHAVIAHLCQATGLDPLNATMRLAPAALVPATVLMVATVARRLARREVAGWLAAALFAVLSESVATTWSVNGVGYPMVQPGWWASVSQTAGWVVLVALVGAGIAFVRRGGADAAVPVALLPVLALLATGTKSSLLPPVVAGFALATAVAVVRRRWREALRPALVTGLCGASMLLGLLTIYRGGSYGLRLDPFVPAQLIASRLFPGSHGPTPATAVLPFPEPWPLVVLAGALFLLPALARAGGVIPLVRRRWRDPAVQVVLGTCIAGLGASQAFRHPGSSESYFLTEVFPLAAVGSAWGWVVAFERRTRRLPWVLPVLGATTVGALCAWGVATLAGRGDPNVGRLAPDGTLRPHDGDPVWSWVWPWLLLGAVLSLAVVVALLLARRAPGRRWAPLVPVLGVALFLGPGALGTVLTMTGADSPDLIQQLRQTSPSSLHVVTPDMIRTGRWLRAHARPTDVMAVSRPCTRVAPTPANHGATCDARYFSMTALSGLRADVEGWSYSDRIVENAWNTQRSYPLMPFWDQPRLDQEMAAFHQPTASGLRALRRDHHVRWLVADLRRTHIATKRLDRLAVRRLSLPTMVVWELPGPRARTGAR